MTWLGWMLGWILAAIVGAPPGVPVWQEILFGLCCAGLGAMIGHAAGKE